MNRELVAILACPVCRGRLRFDGEGPHAATPAAELTAGTLVCTACGEKYAVKDGVPDLLLPKYRGIPASKLPGAN